VEEKKTSLQHLKMILNHESTPNHIQKFYVHRGRDPSDWDVHLQKELDRLKSP